PRPVDAEKVLRRDLAPFAKVIAQLHRIGAVLVDHDHHIQAAAARPYRSRGSAEQTLADPPAPTGVHAPTFTPKPKTVKRRSALGYCRFRAVISSLSSYTISCTCARVAVPETISGKL